MQSTRRLAMPIRVHQLWDAIGHSSAGQNMDFEKLVSVVTNLYKIPRDELNHELNYAIKDQLVFTEVVETQRREETEIYRLPNLKTLDRGDHDWYCFKCHLAGPVVKCEDCPRVFHLDCLPEDRKPDKDLFVCPPCHIISTKPSAERVNVKQKALNQLIQYVCERFKSWKAPYLEKADGTLWAEATGRTAKDAWRFETMVFLPMDLSVMSGKADAGKYQSLEEFQVDCETLLHSIGVYFGLDLLKGSQIGAAFIRDAMHDIDEIKLCHECFRRSNEKNHEWWFCLPCAPQHEVVWAKQTGYPFWPAKVMKHDDKKWDVRYFGGNYERGIIDVKNIKPIETPISALKIRRNVPWNDAYDELQKFQEIAKNPDLVNSLPSRKGGSSKKTTKRSANILIEESATPPPPKKIRKGDTATPAKNQPKKSSGAGSSAKKDSSTPKTNGTPQTSSVSKKKTSTKGVNNPSAAASTPARRDSAAARSSSVASASGSGKLKKTSSGSVGASRAELSDIADGSLDPDILSLLNEMDDESFEGSVYFSDEETKDLVDKVSEDAVSSSCNESKTSRNAYVQVNRPDCVPINIDKLSKYVSTLKERQAAEISQNKKKQWCFNCEREAIYHCCWNTAYCSIECQQQHWTKEHKRLCRRPEKV